MRLDRFRHDDILDIAAAKRFGREPLDTVGDYHRFKRPALKRARTDFLYVHAVAVLGQLQAIARRGTEKQFFAELDSAVKAPDDKKRELKKKLKK